jgi:hypothetical protein
MSYPVIPNADYDFAGESYADCYPNIHPYPATMIPQLGIKILRELGVLGGRILDPYCGSGSSFAAALDCHVTHLDGCDLNPLALLICQAKFTPVNLEHLRTWQGHFHAFFSAQEADEMAAPPVHNWRYWFAPSVFRQLVWLKTQIDSIPDLTVQRLFSVPFAETARECSYTRKNEFKLYRIAEPQIYQPNVLATYLKHLDKVLAIYQRHYQPRLHTVRLQLADQPAALPATMYDIILTSPPYGDSRTTVAYGQFSCFANEWLGNTAARKLDQHLMGGRASKVLYDQGVLAEPIRAIQALAPSRALEVSSFYHDLGTSIRDVASRVAVGGKVVYVVGNRIVKGVQLPTDQFVAEQFEASGLQHRVTYLRRLSNKVMPARNSPSNQKGASVSTMTHEYIVVCERVES